MLLRVATQRKFIYKDNELADPNPKWDQAQVLDHYANVYPELVTSKIDETINKDGSFRYEFKNNLGTKG